MNFSRLYEKYEGFHRPTFTLRADGSELRVGEGIRIHTLQCCLTTLRQAGSVFVAAELAAGAEEEETWRRAVQLGAVCTLALGYQKSEITVFSGFIYDVTWDAPLGGGAQYMEMICLDVRGQLMLSAKADAGTPRTLSQMVNEVLGQSCCGRMAENTQVGAVPEELDLPVQRTGSTDFAVVCQAADFLCFEFYAFAEALYFGPPRPSSETAVSFDGPNGLMSLRRRRTLAGQCAAVAVSGADDRGERLYARQVRQADTGPGAGRMSQALALDLHQAEPAVRTMGQASRLAQARMETLQRRCGSLIGRGTGLPELRPGRFVEISGINGEVDGRFYIQSVTHTIDETGFETSFEAEE